MHTHSCWWGIKLLFREESSWSIVYSHFRRVLEFSDLFQVLTLAALNSIKIYVTLLLLWVSIWIMKDSQTSWKIKSLEIRNSHTCDFCVLQWRHLEVPGKQVWHPRALVSMATRKTSQSGRIHGVASHQHPPTRSWSLYPWGTHNFFHRLDWSGSSA